jgi:hypothetical protein
MTSQNYGWICVAPVIGGNTFNLLFGRVHDSNTVSGLDFGGLDSSDSGSTNPLACSSSLACSSRCDPLTYGQVGKIGSPHAGLEKRGGVSLPDDGSHDCECDLKLLFQRD